MGIRMMTMYGWYIPSVGINRQRSMCLGLQHVDPDRGVEAENRPLLGP